MNKLSDCNRSDIVVIDQTGELPRIYILYNDAQWIPLFEGDISANGLPKKPLVKPTIIPRNTGKIALVIPRIKFWLYLNRNSRTVRMRSRELQSGALIRLDFGCHIAGYLTFEKQVMAPLMYVSVRKEEIVRHKHTPLKSVLKNSRLFFECYSYLSIIDTVTQIIEDESI